MRFRGKLSPLSDFRSYELQSFSLSLWNIFNTLCSNKQSDIKHGISEVLSYICMGRSWCFPRAFPYFDNMVWITLKQLKPLISTQCQCNLLHVQPGLCEFWLAEQQEFRSMCLWDRHRRVELRTAITSQKRWNTRENLIWDFRIENHETNGWDFQRVTKNKELELVEELAPSKAEKEAAHGVRAGYVGALATPGVMAPTVWRERERDKIRELWIMVRTWTNFNLIREPLWTVSHKIVITSK
jgi:hypothetical protein